jgi:Mce-associated membrane protein
MSNKTPTLIGAAAADDVLDTGDDTPDDDAEGPRELGETVAAADSDHAAIPPPPDAAPTRRTRRWAWTRLLAYGVLPALVMSLTLGAAYLKWRDESIRATQAAAEQSVRTATDTTIAVLSYRPDTVDRDLTAARDRLTGPFADQYSQLVHDVVAPGAKQKHIAAQATVPAAASVSATDNHAVVLVFVNQTVNVGTDPPSSTASSVRVTLDKVDDRWLISAFDPI